LQDDFESSLGEQRTMALLIGLFGAIALTLAAVGLYGTMSYMAGQRRMELGIRLALGAKPRSLLTMLVLDGLRLVAIGTALGLAGAVAAVRLIESQLFGVAPTDLATFTVVAVLLLAIGALACAIPALRAMRLDPVVVLRS
jgi:ABC-type antimicrobial peptide transport system permease subunit